MRPEDLPTFFAQFEKDFPSFFHEFEKEFARMQGMMGKIMEDAMKHAQSPRRGEPFVYGFSLRVGQDGTPHIQPFGSPVTAPLVGGEENPAPREPLSDLLEGEKEITLTIELPGVEKEDVKLHVAEDAVTVRVEKGRRYATRRTLPAKVVPGSAKATFKNGVLDITLTKADQPDEGHPVAIE